MREAKKVVTRLREIGFRVEEERLELFGEVVPLLKAIAVDDEAQQLALVAEQDKSPRGDDPSGQAFDESWRQLLFAVSGLRHHLRGSRLPALSSPVLLAIVDDAGARSLRGLVEQISEDYALFSRLDINIVDASSVGDPESLDHALASLLPHTRRAIKADAVVAPQDAEEFWRELDKEIRRPTAQLERQFGHELTIKMIQSVLEDLRADVEPGTKEEVRVASPPLRVTSLELENFRSFEREKIELAPATVVHGANGSGKTSVCEALEIAWSGWTQRIPEDEEVTPETYKKHLNREGQPFSIGYAFVGDKEPRRATEVGDTAAIPIGRTVLAQHVLDQMASGSPKDRFKAFLATSGLDLPELDDRVSEMRRTAFEEANRALSEAGIDRIRAVSSKAVGHLDHHLRSAFAEQLPSGERLDGAAEALRRVSEGAYRLKPMIDPELPRLLSNVDAVIAEVRTIPEQAADPVPQMEEALIALREGAAALRAIADPLRSLARQSALALSQPLVAKEADELPSSPLPASAAARWLSHVRGVEQSIPELEDLAMSIQDAAWRKRLEDYVEALRTAVSGSSAEKVERLRRDTEAHLEQKPPQSFEQPSIELVAAAGFDEEPILSADSVAAMSELCVQLANRAAGLDEVAARIETHPARSFLSRGARVMPALCRFELTRELARQGGAVKRARETLVTSLLDRRLSPLVCEFVAALVRFEWYFEPLQIDVSGDRLRMSKLATRDPKLDVRLLLNAAERTVVGIAWFLALHVLQPKEHRRVLALDDPASGFDAMNKAAFVATLRSVVRLLQPEQILITTHDEALVVQLEQELAEVGGWPAGVGVLRCRRTDTGASEVIPGTIAGDMEAAKADRGRELSALSPEIARAPAQA